MTTIAELGWTPEFAAKVRAFFEVAGWAEDWDDTEMDVYDDDNAIDRCECMTEDE